MTIFVIIGLLGAALIVLGVSLWSVPAGCVTAGTELLAVAYGGAYLQARTSRAT